MIHQGHAVVESQGVLIAECGPGEFLGEAGGWGSAGVMEPILFGGAQRSSKSMASLREISPKLVHCLGWCHIMTRCFFLGYRSISLKWTDLGNKKLWTRWTTRIFWNSLDRLRFREHVQKSRRFLVVMF